MARRGLFPALNGLLDVQAAQHAQYSISSVRCLFQRYRHALSVGSAQRRRIFFNAFRNCFRPWMHSSETGSSLITDANLPSPFSILSPSRHAIIVPPNVVPPRFLISSLLRLLPMVTTAFDRECILSAFVHLGAVSLHA